MEIGVLIERTDTGYSAYSPDLPGCVAAGETIDETKRLMREAIDLYISEIRLSGTPLPKSSTVAFEVFKIAV